MRIDTTPVTPAFNDLGFLAALDRPAANVTDGGPCDELGGLYERRDELRDAAQRALDAGVPFKGHGGLKATNDKIARLEKECAGEKSTPRPVEATKPTQPTNAETTPTTVPAPKPCGKCPRDDDNQ